MANPIPSRGAFLWRLFWGMIVADAAGLLLCLLAFQIARWAPDREGAVAYPSLALIPLVIGFVCAWAWRPLNLKLSPVIFTTGLATVIAVSASYWIFGEGFVCLLIVSPLLYCFVLSGAMAGRFWFRKAGSRLNVFVLPALALAVLGEPFLRGPHEGVVVDEIRIAAPPAKVWPHVLAFDTIPARPAYWLFRAGLPYPVKTTNGGNFVGADRACEFSGGAAFKEKVRELETERLLTFDIIEMPPDPELIGHLDAHRGQFELRDNGDGTTTLIGRTWYSLHVRPAFYFDWWTHSIFRAVHLRVMENVKILAEAKP